MARKDKKNRKCICCEKTFASPQKLRQHYKSNKNQCTSSPPSQNIARSQLSEADPETVNPPVDMINENIHDLEAGPGPATQAHRDEQRNSRTPFSNSILDQAIIPWEPPPRINIKQFKTIFSRHG